MTKTAQIVTNQRKASRVCQWVNNAASPSAKTGIILVKRRWPNAAAPLHANHDAIK